MQGEKWRILNVLCRKQERIGKIINVYVEKLEDDEKTICNISEKWAKISYITMKRK